MFRLAADLYYFKFMKFDGVFRSIVCFFYSTIMKAGGCCKRGEDLTEGCRRYREGMLSYSVIARRERERERGSVRYYLFWG